MKKRLQTLSYSALALAVAVAAGCGGSDSSDTAQGVAQAQNDYEAYNGPGSKWDVDLFTDGTFAIERRATPLTPVVLTVSGTFERFDSGFVGLTVGEAEGEDAPVAGDQAWALEVPGYAFLLKPMNSDRIIAMVKSGECPEADIDANWVIVKQDAQADATDAGRDYFGTFHYDYASGAPSLPSKYSVATGFPAVNSGGIGGSGTCEEGLMLVGEAPDMAAMYLTQTGGAIVQTNIADDDQSQFIFALGQKAIEDIANLEGSYAGMLFDDSMDNGNTVSPVSMSCDDAGTCTGNLVTDIESGATEAGASVTVTLNGLVDDLGDGFVTGMISDPEGGTGNLACMVDINANDSERRIVNCAGQSPGDNTRSFNVMFVSL